MCEQAMDALIATLKSKFPQAVLAVHQDPQRGELSVQVRAEHLQEIGRFLHDDPVAAFDHITDVCSADYPSDAERFEVIYHFLSLPHGRRIRVKARVTEDDPTIPTITGIWKGAEFMEREVYDLMGIRSAGLMRIPGHCRSRRPSFPPRGLPLR